MSDYLSSVAVGGLETASAIRPRSLSLFESQPGRPQAPPVETEAAPEFAEALAVTSGKCSRPSGPLREPSVEPAADLLNVSLSQQSLSALKEFPIRPPSKPEQGLDEGTVTIAPGVPNSAAAEPLPEPRASLHVAEMERKPILPAPSAAGWQNNQPASFTRPALMPVLPMSPMARGEASAVSAPPIHVTIGRLEIRAAAPADKPQTQKTAGESKPRLSLDQFLQRRAKGGGA